MNYLTVGYKCQLESKGFIPRWSNCMPYFNLASAKDSSEEIVSSDLDSDTDSRGSKRLCYGSDPGFAVLASENSALKRKKTKARRKSEVCLLQHLPVSS